ncbi:MAG: T9SS type A sorting domain-containing protein, partial [Bacteroidales bacterium]|nr:T9SS type A sorting domain-containing protein [Bacteroidales bacterium]
PSTINVWKIVAGKRVEKLNACFKDLPPDLDGICSPGDWLYIMSTNYDSSGQYYFDATIEAEKDMLCEIRLGLNLAADSSILDAGDKICISREFRATSEDMWAFVPTNVIEKNVELPNSFALYQNYPNPFNPITKIKFSIDKQSVVSLKIYNIMGQEIVELLNKNICSGTHSVQWDGNNKLGQSVSSGLYFAKLISNKQDKLIKMLLIR